jgi:hypothetical protein
MPTFLRIAASFRSLNPMIFCPSIQISPASGCIKPMRCLSNTLFPPPLRPMMTSVSPFETVRSIPHKISWRPMLFVNPRTAIIVEELRGSS